MLNKNDDFMSRPTSCNPHVYWNDVDLTTFSLFFLIGVIIFF